MKKSASVLLASGMAVLLSLAAAGCATHSSDTMEGKAMGDSTKGSMAGENMDSTKEKPVGTMSGEQMDKGMAGMETMDDKKMNDSMDTMKKNSMDDGMKNNMQDTMK